MSMNRKKSIRDKWFHRTDSNLSAASSSSGHVTSSPRTPSSLAPLDHDRKRSGSHDSSQSLADAMLQAQMTPKPGPSHLRDFDNNRIGLREEITFVKREMDVDDVEQAPLHTETILYDIHAEWSRTVQEMLRGRFADKNYRFLSNLSVRQIQESIDGQAWVQDDVFHAYIALLRQYSARESSQVALLSPSFFDILSQQEVTGGKLLHFESHSDGIEQYDCLLGFHRVAIPVFLPKGHFVTVAVEMKAHRVVLVDTLGYSRMHWKGDVGEPHVLVARFVQRVMGMQQWHSEGWTVYVQDDVPEQPIGGECGPVSLLFLRRSIANLPLLTNKDISPLDFTKLIRNFRLRIAAELMANRLNPSYRELVELQENVGI